MSIVDQALFNTEYRLSSHSIEVIKAYKESPAVVTKVTIARNLLIGTLMNIVDNAIYWLDQQYFKSIDKSESFSKKIWINIIDETDYINIVIADNGTGFLVSINNVTEPFVSGKPGGMGLGLHIASEVMLAQKGRLIFPNEGDYNIPNEFNSGATVVL